MKTDVSPSAAVPKTSAEPRSMSLNLHEIIADKSRIEIILDFLPYPFLIAEQRNGIFTNTFINRRFEQEIGYTLAEIPDADAWFTLAYPDIHYRQTVITGWNSRLATARENSQDAVMMRVVIQTKHVGEQWYEVKSSVSGPLQLVAFVCITDVVAKERELQRLVETKNRTLSILAHDVRGPLTNLHSMTQFLIEGNLSRDEFVNKIERIHEKSGEVLDFIDTTLNWTKANFNSIQVEAEQVNIRECAWKIFKLYESSYHAKQVKVLVNIAVDTYLVDKEIFTIVVRNIFSNAVKFTPSNGSINIQTQLRGSKLRVSVKDSGIGMTPGMIDKIYQENYTSTPGTNEEKGLGLGLKLCRHLIHKLGGTLEIKSEPGLGTEVVVVI